MKMLAKQYGSHTWLPQNLPSIQQVTALNITHMRFQIIFIDLKSPIILAP